MSSNPTIRWLMSATVIVMLALVVLQFSSKPSAASDPTQLIRNDAAELIEAAPVAERSVATPTVAARIAVDVIGAVQQPGVVWLPVGARIDDAVRAAGGLAPDADREAINMAAPLMDGQQIRVQRVGETMALAAPMSGEPALADGGLININTADAAMLETLPGVGPATAAAIVSHRAANGAFKRIEDIENVKGIGPSLVEQIRGQITVDP